MLMLGNAPEDDRVAATRLLDLTPITAPITSAAQRNLETRKWSRDTSQSE
jgi:hypothetical protein